MPGYSAHTPSTAGYMEKLASLVAAWRLGMGLENGDVFPWNGLGTGASTVHAAVFDHRIIREEVDELRDAICAEDEMDAILDIIFATLSYATRRYTPAQIGECWAAVCAANGRKTDGPIIEGKKRKPEGWVGPEAEIAEALNRPAVPAQAAPQP